MIGYVLSRAFECLHAFSFKLLLAMRGGGGDGVGGWNTHTKKTGVLLVTFKGLKTHFWFS